MAEERVQRHEIQVVAVNTDLMRDLCKFLVDLGYGKQAKSPFEQANITING